MVSLPDTCKVRVSPISFLFSYLGALLDLNVLFQAPTLFLETSFLVGRSKNVSYTEPISNWLVSIKEEEEEGFHTITYKPA